MNQSFAQQRGHVLDLRLTCVESYAPNHVIIVTSHRMRHLSKTAAEVRSEFRLKGTTVPEWSRIRVLWIEAQRGALCDAAAFNGWLLKEWKASALRFLKADQTPKIITALKTWKSRAA